jgi:imidazolonepropionase-like amidohydrolase
VILAALVFAHVTVVDVEKGGHRLNQTVVVEGNRIAAVGPATSMRVPRGAQVINSQGKFLIPGLWDMHVHDLDGPGAMETFLANGVTGVRDMFEYPERLRKLLAKPAGLRIVSQRGIMAGAPEGEGRVVVRTPETARQAVARQIAEGADFIQVYNSLSRDAYFAVAEECRRRGIPFVGHTPDAVSTTEAAAAGQRSIEHLDGVLLDCSRNHTALRRARRFTPDWRVCPVWDLALPHPHDLSRRSNSPAARSISGPRARSRVIAPRDGCYRGDVRGRRSPAGRHRYRHASYPAWSRPAR